MELESKLNGDALVISIDATRIDAAVAIQFKEKVREMAQDGPDRVVLDMGTVEFLDSSGLGALVAAMKQLGSDRNLELASLTPAVEKVFRLTRMDSVFKVHPDTSTALNAA